MFDTVTSDPEMREFIRMRNKGLRDFNSAIYHAEARGRAEGEARGEARGRAEGEARGKVEGEAQGKLEKAQEMALKLISKGMQPDDVAEITGLTASEIHELRSK